MQRIIVKWDGVKYTVNVPEYEGGVVVPLDDVQAALQAKDEQIAKLQMIIDDNQACCDERARLEQELERVKGERDKYKMECLVKFNCEVCSGALEDENDKLREQIDQLKQAHADLLKEACKVIKGFMGPMDKWGEWDEGCFYYHQTTAAELQEPIRCAQAFLRTQEQK